ncbi:MAG: N-acetylmuramoyl-L-alanine amidase [Cyclobacteriaceae bacterium]|nr:N-acetylmuramoyl-L-alanine amidase [Cyclobacteriaceae bacterium]
MPSHRNYQLIFGITLVIFILFTTHIMASDVLLDKRICIDPGHGDTAASDTFRIGPSGEREEWINLRVALMLRDLLEAKGAKVIMTRTEDTHIELADRAKLAVRENADVFLSIHHNATADSAVNFPIVYFHGNRSENEASVHLGALLANQFRNKLFGGDGPVSLVSDLTIYPGSGTAVLRHSYGIPGVIGEASFFSNPSEEQRLKQESYNLAEAYAYLEALETFFSTPVSKILAKNSRTDLPPFDAFKAAGRMSETAKAWMKNYLEAKKLFESGEKNNLTKAYDLFTLSAKSFADSPVAVYCHQYRARIHLLQGQKEAAEIEFLRVAEHYVKIDDDE